LVAGGQARLEFGLVHLGDGTNTERFLVEFFKDVFEWHTVESLSNDAFRVLE
jgi:hypothetical protein